MKRVMIDIETLGTEPGAAIASIGAVTFDESGINDEFYRSVDVGSAQDAGLSIDAETLAWWFEQSPEARAELLGGDDLEGAMRAFRAFVHDADEIWANSPAFDCVLLEQAFEAVGVSCPWDFWMERDYRTVKELVDEWPDADVDGVEHNAADDARHQAECLIDSGVELDE